MDNRWAVLLSRIRSFSTGSSTENVRTSFMIRGDMHFEARLNGTL
jgi:hypothetical protein